jgi:glycine betaine/choline ABC-type transport system substrate-binding protein
METQGIKINWGFTGSGGTIYKKKIEEKSIKINVRYTGTSLPRMPKLELARE